MTKEEAYEIIEEVKNKICNRKYVTEQSEAFDKALELLKQEPCEDAISRQAVLDLVNTDWKYENLESDIANLPPVTPQPKTGHWTEKESIPYLIHKEMGIPISECQKAYEVAIDYLRSQGKVRG